MISEKRGDTVKEEKIRISKPPEERKQEIMDAAMRAFTEKGYEQTTMRDIAAVIGVIPGLCYRYFNSKQELFDSAVSQYVLDYCAPIVQALKRYRGDIDGLLDCVADLFLDRDGKEKYHEFFHQADNKTFHSLLFLSNCDYLFPYVKSFFDSLNENGTAAVADTASFSKFVLYGLFPILNDDELSPERKTELARSYITGLLKLQ